MCMYMYYTLGGVGWPRGGRSSWVKSIQNNMLLWEICDFSCLIRWIFWINKLIFTDHVLI